MGKWWIRGWMLVVGLLASGAWAQITPAAAEHLLKRSGGWSQLDEFPRHFEAGLREFGGGTALSAQDLDRLRRAAAESFSTEKLRGSVQKSISLNINAQDHAELLRWYNSDTGQLVTGLDISASQSFSDLNAILAEGNAALAAASPQRQALLQQIVHASRAAEFQVNAMIHTAVGVYRGVMSVASRPNAPPAEEFQRNMERQRPQMLASAMGTNAALTAAAYATLTDQEIVSLLNFLTSRVGKRWVGVANTAMTNAMDQCAQDFGSKLVKVKPVSPL